MTAIENGPRNTIAMRPSQDQKPAVSGDGNNPGTVKKLLITPEQTAAAAKKVVENQDCIPDCVNISPKAKEEINASQKAKQWVDKNVPVQPTKNGVKGLAFRFKF